MHKQLRANLTCSLPIISKEMSEPCVLTMYEYVLEAQIKKYAAISAKISTIENTKKAGGITIVE
jgi:hypothetical protein